MTYLCVLPGTFFAATARRALLALSGLVLIAAAVQAGAAVRGEPVEYKADGTVLKGYLAWDDAVKGKRPGVLVVHEWWGHNEYARTRARQLAELGYTALAVDMYGEGKTADHPQTAGQFSSEVRKNLPLAKKRFEAAAAVLRRHPTVDPKRIAAIGYCFGGAIVLEMARQGVDLKGVVSFHGALNTEHPARPGQVKAKVLVLNGADDPMIKPEAIEAFKKEMDAAGVDYRFVNYPGAKHSFTNPQATEFGKKFNLPLEYHPEADRESWTQMQAFLKEVFGQK
jgi:dienelactone hydrolase